MAKAETTQKAPETKPEKPKETFLEFISSMASVLVVGLFIITFNVQAFTIPSESMRDTLLIGDHVFVDRVTFAPPTSAIGKLEPYRNIRNGDIVVFLSPVEPGLHVVKRIIGIPGDRIRLRDGILYLNGKRMEEPFVRRLPIFDPWGDNFPNLPTNMAKNQLAPEWRILLPSYVNGEEIVVPPDMYFAMGDNRYYSYDSRYWGFIPRENIIGRPLFIYWSFESDGTEYTETGLAQRGVNIARKVIRFFPDTRWKRLFTPVR